MCLLVLLLCAAGRVTAQRAVNDTIRVGGIEVNGKQYAYIFLNEVTCASTLLNAEDRDRINKLRVNVYAVYSYALPAGTVFKKVQFDMAGMEDRRARKKYLKSMDRQLDKAFKEPLKNLSIEQGHVLISLINRQTGDNCYNVIKELKGGFSAMMWQGVGVFFNNSLTRNYEPNGRDKDIEMVTQELEASAAYRYQIYLQDEMMKRIGKK